MRLSELLPIRSKASSITQRGSSSRLGLARSGASSRPTLWRRAMESTVGYEPSDLLLRRPVRRAREARARVMNRGARAELCGGRRRRLPLPLPAARRREERRAARHRRRPREPRGAARRQRGRPGALEARRVRCRGGTEVYRAEGIELCAGDRIRWTRNDGGLGLVNSQTAEGMAANDGPVTFGLEDGRTLDMNAGDPRDGGVDVSHR